MKSRSLFVINNSDKLATFADRLETIDGFRVIVTLGSSKLDEARKWIINLMYNSTPWRILSHLRRASCAWPDNERNLGSNGLILENGIVS